MKGVQDPEQEDHWSPVAYQKAAAFVPELATKVVQWLDVQPHDSILDIGCGDGVLTHQIALSITRPGSIMGIDSSASMIKWAQEKYSLNHLAFSNLSAHSLPTSVDPKVTPTWSKVFSNAAMHWILRPEVTRLDFFKRVHAALKPNGVFVFEMGGMGNVSEMRAALMIATARRIGLQKAKDVDPWFFPDENWMRDVLEKSRFIVEKLETEYRPTPVTAGDEKESIGVEGWVRLMGKQFLDAVENECGCFEREKCTKEVVEVLEEVCEAPGGRKWIGYVRLRGMAKRIG